MNRTFFKLKINIPNLDSFMGSSDPCVLSYSSELVIDEKEEKIGIKIFYPHKEYLGEKIARWYHGGESELLNHFEVVEPKSPEELVTLAFDGFKCIGISNSSNDYEVLNSNEPALKFTVITTTGIRIKYNDPSAEPSAFYLNSAGFPLVEMNYKYPFRFPGDETPYSWEPKNEVTDFIKFDQIEFKPEHNFYNTTKYDSNLVSVKKEPRLLVKNEGLSEEEKRKHVSMVCALMSFYANADVEYFVAKVNAKDGRFHERKIEKKISTSGHGIFMWDFSRNPLNLIVNVDAGRLMANYEFVMDAIKRFNYALQLSGESKFMILYNVLEQTRVQYIMEGKIEQEKAGDPPILKKVTQEYEFTKSKKEVEEPIKAALEKMAELVRTDQQDDFKKEISAKVDNIKLMSMMNQFKSLFLYTKIEPTICNLDFDKIKKLRNKIFHGTPIDDADTEYLDKISRYDRFPRFVGIMLLKYFGIDDLKLIQKKYR